MELRYRPGRQPLKNGQVEVGSRLVKQLERIVSIHVLLIAIATSISSIHEDIGTDSHNMVSHGLGVCLWLAFLVHTCTILFQQSSSFWVADMNHFGSSGFGKMAFYVGRCRTLWHRGNIGIDWRWCIGLFAQVRGILQSRNVLDDWSVIPEACPNDEMTTQSQSSVFARPLSTRMERGEENRTDATTLRDEKDD
jgi:hypothetical protein